MAQGNKTTCNNCGSEVASSGDYSPLCMGCRSLLQANHKTYYFIQEKPGYQLPEVDSHLVITGKGDIKFYFGPDDDELNIEFVDAMLALLKSEWPSGEWQKDTSKSDYLTPIYCPSIDEAVSDTPMIVGKANKNTKALMQELLASKRTKDKIRELMDTCLGGDEPVSRSDGVFKL